jgi:hypothetical protein
MEKPTNYAAFYSLLLRLPHYDKEELKKNIVLQYTAGRTESLREMSTAEYAAALEGIKKAAAPNIARQELRNRRSAVLCQMQLMGINTADWDAVDAFCLDKRIAGKRFCELDGGELEALQVKLRAIRRKGYINLKINLN